MRYGEEKSFGRQPKLSGGRIRPLVVIYAVLALSMFVLGLLSHRIWIISKIQATPTWMFFCVAISAEIARIGLT